MKTRKQIPSSIIESNDIGTSTISYSTGWMFFPQEREKCAIGSSDQVKASSEPIFLLTMNFFHIIICAILLCGAGGDDVVFDHAESNVTPRQCDPTVEFDCGGGTCIRLDQVCDGKNDCPKNTSINTFADEPPNQKCDQIDHCKSNPCVGSICQNTIEGPVCTCQTGFEKDLNRSTPNRLMCKDKNECLEDNPKRCSQICENTVGGFVCSCEDGYRLADYDRSTCLRRAVEVECEPECLDCPKGYEWKRVGGGPEDFVCVDKDECDKFSPRLCMHNCTNTIGSFMCSCLPGYALASDGTTCLRHGQVDVEYEGPPIATCPPGFQRERMRGSMESCVDIDECDKWFHRQCMHNCTNTIGSFECSCLPGYALDFDGTTCLRYGKARETTTSPTAPTNVVEVFPTWGYALVAISCAIIIAVIVWTIWRLKESCNCHRYRRGQGDYSSAKNEV